MEEKPWVRHRVWETRGTRWGVGGFGLGGAGHRGIGKQRPLAGEEWTVECTVPALSLFAIDSHLAMR